MFGCSDQLEFCNRVILCKHELSKRAVELEVRAHIFWSKANKEGFITEEWTPYGYIGETYH
jgi:hypothetical protein